MSNWTSRLPQNNKKTEAIIMFSDEGAKFQEKALSMLDYKGSPAHKIIGTLVTMINNNQISVAQAQAEYVAALSN